MFLFSENDKRLTPSLGSDLAPSLAYAVAYAKSRAWVKNATSACSATVAARPCASRASSNCRATKRPCKEDGRLIIEPKREKSLKRLIAQMQTWEPLGPEDQFPEIEDLPAKPFTLFDDL